MGRMLGSRPVAVQAAAAVVVPIVVLTACYGESAPNGSTAVGDRGPSASAGYVTTIPAEVPPDDDPTASTISTAPSDDLAPSQVSASTVEPPSTPSFCDPDELELWTSRSIVRNGVADVVIRIDSTGDRTCEVDLTGTPMLAAEAEPTVWLDPGAGAEVFLVAAPEACASAPAPLQSVALLLGGVERRVAVNTVVACEQSLATLAPIDDVGGTCAAGDLRARLVPDTIWLLVRNESARPCRLGELTGVVVDAAPWTTYEQVFGPGPSRDRRPLTLAPGDVVGTQLGLDTSYGCDAAGDAQLEIAGGGAVPIEDFERCVFLDPAFAVPYVSNPNGPLADFGTTDFEIDSALEWLDPFAAPIRNE